MNVLSRLAAAFTGLALTLVASAGFASSASAAFPTSPLVGPSWTPDGPVHAVVMSPDGTRIYVGGSFTGGVAALDAGDGSLVWRGSANGDVRALAMSGSTHVLAGGAFTTVSGVTHRKLALLSADTGVADTRWRAAAGGTVRDIVVSGGTAYFGGGFANHNGIIQANLGAVSTTPGVKASPVTAFDTSTNGIVYSLAMSGSRLIVGGRFTAVNGRARAQLASIDVSTNTLEPWAPLPACPNCNLYWDLVVDGGSVYAASRNAGAVTAVDLLTGNRSWRTPSNGDAQAVTFVDGPTPLLYVGGHFTGIRGTQRTILAALNPSDGTVDPFSPRFVTTFPGIWALASTGSRLYAGGHFTAAGPTPNRYPYLAMFG